VNPLNYQLSRIYFCVNRCLVWFAPPDHRPDSL